MADPRVDLELCRRFSRELTMLRSCPARAFLSDPQTGLAAVLLFDQRPRNLYRGTSQAYAYDPLVRVIARMAMERGFDSALTRRERQFLAMPLMHSEKIADQRAALRYYAKLGQGFGWEYARAHHTMIARFGRFPHRNEVLGRKSTSAEERAVREGYSW